MVQPYDKRWDAVTLDGHVVTDVLDAPLHWRKPRAVRLHGDLFHPDVPDDFIAQVFAVMALAPRHTFQILTKRPERMQSLLSDDDFWFSVEDYASDFARRPISVESPITSVWLGVSVEDQATADQRIPLLLETPAALRFVSYEPALGPVDFSAHGAHALPDHHPSGDGRGGWWSDLGNLPGEPHVDWIIVGGESGPNARTFDVQWARDTITQCRGAGVTVFVKQLGANPVVWFFGSDLPINLKHRAGADPSEWPEDLRVQEWPA